MEITPPLGSSLSALITASVLISFIVVFPILVDIKRGDQQSETASQPSIQTDKVDWPMGSWPRPLLDFDHIGQKWEDSSRCRVAESAERGLKMFLKLRPVWTRPRVRIASARVNARRHGPSANMERHARRPAGRHGFNGLCCPTNARHSTSIKKLIIRSASLVAVLLLEKRTAVASRRGQWFMIVAPSRRRFSPLNDTCMRESQLGNGMLFKMSLDFGWALPKIQFYSSTVVKPSIRFRRDTFVPDKCRVPGPGARSRSTTTCMFETSEWSRCAFPMRKMDVGIQSFSIVVTSLLEHGA